MKFPVLKEIDPPLLPPVAWRGPFEEEVFVASEIGEQEIRGYFVSYRYLYTYTTDPKMRKNLPFIPLGINGVVRRDGKILFGKRGKMVTQFPLWWELPPSGAISRGSEGLDPKLHLLKELKEETGIVRVKDIQPLAQILNQELERYELCFVIDVEEEAHITEEYEELIWLRENDSLSRMGEEIVPLSRLLFTRYLKR